MPSSMYFNLSVAFHYTAGTFLRSDDLVKFCCECLSLEAEKLVVTIIFHHNLCFTNASIHRDLLGYMKYIVKLCRALDSGYNIN